MSVFFGDNFKGYDRYIWRDLFADRLRCFDDVQVNGMGGVPTPPIDNDYFNVYLYSAPVQRTPLLRGHRIIAEHQMKYLPTVDTMFGIPVACRDDSCLPTYQEHVIHCPEGTVVAECIGGRHLYFLHNIAGGAQYSEFNIAHRILDEFHKHLSCSENERAFRAQSWSHYRAGQFALHAGRIGEMQDFVLEKYLGQTREQQTSASAIVASKVGLDLRYQLASQVDDAGFSQKILDQLARIQALPQVKEVDLDIASSSLQINTTPLTCLDLETNQRHLIGRMEIRINLLDSSVTWTNQDRTDARGWQAPGINADGEALYEPLILQFVGMIPTFELFPAARLAIQYAESIPRAVFWADNIKLWPLCS